MSQINLIFPQQFDILLQDYIHTHINKLYVFIIRSDLKHEMTGLMIIKSIGLSNFFSLYILKSIFLYLYSLLNTKEELEPPGGVERQKMAGDCRIRAITGGKMNDAVRIHTYRYFRKPMIPCQAWLQYNPSETV